MRHRIAAVTMLLTLGLLISGCSDAAPNETAVPSSTPTPIESPGSAAGPQRTAVDWEAYAPSVRRRVERFEQEKACVRLRAVRDKVGSGSLATGTQEADAGLITYLDEALQQAVC